MTTTINKPRALYNSQGTRVPSVKTVTNCLASGALIGWLRKNMKDDVRAEAENKRLIGELSHAIIMERYGGSDAVQDDYTMAQIEAATDIADRFDEWITYTFTSFQVKATEVTIISDGLGYGGRFDMYAEADGKKLLLEIKTSPTMYEDHAWQLAGYWKLIQAECPHDYPVDELHVVCPHAETLGGPSCIDFYISDTVREAAVRVFDAALTAYRARKVYTSVAG